MEIAKTLLYVPAVLVLVLGFLTGASLGAGTLSKEIAPDVPPEILGKLLPDAQGLPDWARARKQGAAPGTLCENSRKIHRQYRLQNHREQIKTLMILRVSVYPQKGSEVVAAVAMKTQDPGTAKPPLRSFDRDIPPLRRSGWRGKIALLWLKEKSRVERWGDWIFTG